MIDYVFYSLQPISDELSGVDRQSYQRDGAGVQGACASAVQIIRIFRGETGQCLVLSTSFLVVDERREKNRERLGRVRRVELKW
jgi:hypothetical protein